MRIANFVYFLKNISISHFFQILHVGVILPVLMFFVSIIVKPYIYSNVIISSFFLNDKSIQTLNRVRAQIIKNNQPNYRISINEFDLNQKQIDHVYRCQEENQTSIIAEIDQDGYFLSNIGLLPGLPMIEKEAFVPRKRFILNVVAFGDTVALQKKFKSDKMAFYNELNALIKLNRIGVNVPELLDFDINNLSITYSFIYGKVLREELVKKGALIRERDILKDPNNSQLSSQDLKARRILEGKKVLLNVIDQQTINQIHDQIIKIHACGLMNIDIKYGNIIVENKSSEPFIIDFDTVRDFSKTPDIIKRLIKDIDIQHFNEHFGVAYPTYHTIKEQLNTDQRLKTVYAPVHFGYGLTIGSMWNVDSGYGRWNLILKNVFSKIDITGMRILDLGANNAYNGIQLLRMGADEVVGIELNDQFIEQGKFVIRSFEWADDKKHNYRYIKENFQNLPHLNLGKFDLVTAFCCIYYLTESSMEELVLYLNSITDTLILQCNHEIDIGRNNPETYKKASVEYSVSLLKKCGFPVIHVISPKDYSRPLIIASTK